MGRDTASPAVLCNAYTDDSSSGFPGQRFFQALSGQKDSGEQASLVFHSCTVSSGAFPLRITTPMDPPECGSGHNDRDDKAKQASVSMGKHTTGPEDQRAGPMVRFGQLSEHADKPFYFCSNGEWQKAQSSRIGSPPRSEYKAGSGKEAENTEIGQCQ